MILQLLRLVATPLIFVAVINALFNLSASGRTAVRLLGNLILNTVVAIRGSSC